MFIAVLLLVLLPVITGLFFVNRSKTFLENILLAWLSGFTVLLTLFEIVYLPALYLKWSLHRLCQVFLLLAVILALSAVIVLAVSLKMSGFRENNTVSYGKYKKERKWSAKENLIWIAVCGFILFQAYMSGAYMHVDDDDAYYVATATTSVYTDTIAEFDVYTGLPTEGWNMRYVLSPYPTYLAMISYFSKCHAAILAHVVYPAIFIPMAYGVYYLLSGALFSQKDKVSNAREKRAGFMLMVCIINIFGSYVSYSVSSFLLLRIWQGKAVVCSIMMPAVIYLFLEQLKSYRLSNYILLFAMATSMGVLSSMGIFLAPFIIGVLALAAYWTNKKLSYLVGAVISIVPCICLGALYIFAK